MRAAHFVGRQTQLEHFERHLIHVISGQPRVVLLEGFAGIGKTRFLDQAGRLATEQGFQVSAGRCDETLMQPYMPFADLLPRLEAEEILDEAAVGALYDYAERTQRYLQQSVHKVAESDKLRLMGTVAQAVTALALQTPMLVIVDDLQLADQSSLDLFDYLAFALTEQRTVPLLLIGSYRPVPHETPLGRVLSRLRPEEIVRETTLSGLDETDTRVLLRELGVRQPTQQLLSLVQETTHGVPLFIEEVVHHLVQTRALYTRGGYLSTRRAALETIEWPADLSDAMARRIEVLSPAQQQVLALAACWGDSFTRQQFDLLHQDDGAAAGESVAAGLTHGILMQAGDELRFAHALIRHAFIARLSPETRQGIHLRIARLLERLHAGNPEPYVLEIASHIVAAGDLVNPEIALTYTRQAGNRALALFAWGEAARYYEMALRACQAMDTVVEQDKASLYYQAGIAHYWNQDVGPALDHFENAAKIYKAQEDIRSLAHALLWQVRLHYMYGSVPFGVLPPGVDDLNYVLDILPKEELSLRGNIISILAQAYRHARQAEQASQLAEQALDLGHQAHDDQLRALSADALALTYLGRLYIEEAIANWQSSQSAAQQTGDIVLCRQPLINLPLALNLKGNLEEAEMIALEGVEAAKMVQDWGDFSKVLSHLASIAVAKGDFRATERYALETMRLMERSHYPWGGFRALQALACTAAWRGLQEEAEQTLERIIEPGYLFKSPSHFEHVVVRVFRQLTLAYLSERGTESITLLADELMGVVQYDTYSLAPLCAMVELAEQHLNPVIAERPAAMLAEAVERGVLLTSGWCFLIPRVLGVAAMLREEWEQAADHFLHAIRVATQINALPELARACADFVQLAYFYDSLYDERILAIMERAKSIFSELEMLPHAQLAFKLQEFIFNSLQDIPETETNADHTYEPRPPTRNGTKAIE
ncbi:ATP-binding protein [Candidatus Entotheonella palauensis]|nr:AAA family ATPase [Candidatus Entotheonella palauensis]